MSNGRLFHAGGKKGPNWPCSPLFIERKVQCTEQVLFISYRVRNPNQAIKSKPGSTLRLSQPTLFSFCCKHFFVSFYPTETAVCICLCSVIWWLGQKVWSFSTSWLHVGVRGRCEGTSLVSIAQLHILYGLYDIRAWLTDFKGHGTLFISVFFISIIRETR